MRQCSRREFVHRASSMVCALAAAGACGGDTATSPEPTGIEIAPNEIRITLALVPALTRSGGSVVVSEAQTIVVHAATNDFRAFTNVCTHAGCGIFNFSGGRLRCGCHGSEFDTDGTNVVGPATSPLARYAVTIDSGAGVLRVALLRAK